MNSLGAVSDEDEDAAGNDSGLDAPPEETEQSKTQATEEEDGSHGQAFEPEEEDQTDAAVE